MGDAIGQVLVFAVAVTISPVPISAVVLMLATPRGRVNGPAFLAGWFAGLLVLGTLVLLVSGGGSAGTEGAPATWVSWLKIVLGFALAGVAVGQWRGRPRAGEAAALPAWMQTLDTFTPAKAAGTGVLLSAVNPKNLLLTVGAAAAIAQTGTSAVTQEVALIVFVIVGTVGPAIPVGIALTMGERGTAVLASLKTWMSIHSAAIMTVLCAVIAAKLIGDGISGLSL